MQFVYSPSYPVGEPEVFILLKVTLSLSCLLVFVHTSLFNELFLVFSQWLDVDEAEDEDVAEEGDEAGVVQGDDYQAIHLLLTTPLFVQDFFFFIRGNVL